MSYEFVKATARQLGLYRPLRLGYRHLLDRNDLRRFRAEVDLYRPFVRPGDLCFDVGANYGHKTEVFLALGADVVAFEPQPDCYDEFVARNPRARAVRSAVGSACGTATMFVDRHRTGSSLRPDWRDSAERTITVPIVTLDAIIETYGPPALCKIDVEGYEIEVLRGLSRPIPMITFEFTQRRPADALLCLDQLARFGRFEANITPEDAPRFISERWLSGEEVRRTIKDLCSVVDGWSWGDVFVRRTEP